MMDPYYRTFEGFKILFLKEWIYFKYNFIKKSSLSKINHSHTASAQLLEWNRQTLFPTHYFVPGLSSADHAYECDSLRIHQRLAFGFGLPLLLKQILWVLTTSTRPWKGQNLLDWLYFYLFNTEERRFHK